MKLLLQINDPKYIRRLVKELNYSINGFYNEGIRFNRAKYSSGKLMISCFDLTKEVTEFYFSDAYGREIVASRT